MEALSIKRLKPSLNIKLGHSQRGKLLGYMFLCSVSMIPLSSIVSRTEILNLSLNLEIYFALTKSLSGNKNLRRFLFMIVLICLLQYAK